MLPIIHLARLSPNESSDLPESASRVLRRGNLDGQSKIASLFGLALRGVCLAALVAKRAGALLL